MTPQAAVTDIIRPALQQVSLWSPAAEQLVLATFLHESRLKDRRQIASYGPPVGYGVALGLGQMEPATHDDCWRNYLAYCGQLADDIRKLTAIAAPVPIPAQELVTNDRYAAAMCRVKYRRADEALPEAGDLPAMAAYWKHHYNTADGAGSTEQFLADWHALMG